MGGEGDDGWASWVSEVGAGRRWEGAGAHGRSVITSLHVPPLACPISSARVLGASLSAHTKGHFGVLPRPPPQVSPSSFHLHQPGKSEQECRRFFQQSLFPPRMFWVSRVSL